MRKITTVLFVCILLAGCKPALEPVQPTTTPTTLPSSTPTLSPTATNHPLPPIETIILSIDDFGTKKDNYPNGFEKAPGLPEFGPEIHVQNILFLGFRSADGLSDVGTILVITESAEDAIKLLAMYSKELNLLEVTSPYPQAESLKIGIIAENQIIYANFTYNNTFSTIGFGGANLTIEERTDFLQQLSSAQYLKLVDAYK